MNCSPSPYSNNNNNMPSGLHPNQTQHQQYSSENNPNNCQMGNQFGDVGNGQNTKSSYPASNNQLQNMSTNNNQAFDDTENIIASGNSILPNGGYSTNTNG